MDTKTTLLGLLQILFISCGTESGNRDGGESAPSKEHNDASGSVRGTTLDVDTRDAAYISEDSRSFDELTKALPPKADCGYYESECRGACFTEIGEVHNRCELVFMENRVFDYGDFTEERRAEFEALTVTEESLFVIDISSPNRLLRIDKLDLTVDVMAEDIRTGGGDMEVDPMIVHEGYIYLYTGYWETADDGIFGLMRMPVDGGDLELLYDTIVSREFSLSVKSPKFTIIDDHIYFYGDDSRGLIRIPLDGGDAETVIEEGIFSSFVADDTHYYFNREYPDWEIQRSPRSDPSVREPIYGQEPEHGMMTGVDLFLEADDPDYLYYIDDNYMRILKTGGEPEQVVKRSSGNSSVFDGSQKHLIVNRIGDTRGTFALPRGGGEVLAIENRIYDEALVGEDATHFYLSSRNAVFRIPK